LARGVTNLQHEGSVRFVPAVKKMAPGGRKALGNFHLAFASDPHAELFPARERSFVRPFLARAVSEAERASSSSFFLIFSIPNPIQPIACL